MYVRCRGKISRAFGATDDCAWRWELYGLINAASVSVFLPAFPF